jgi:hypothetical protein
MFATTTFLLLISTLVQVVTAFTPSSSVQNHLTIATTSTSLRPQHENEGIGISIATSSIVSSNELQMDKVADEPSISQRVSKKILDTNFPTWKRRLDTHEDPFNVHKWAGLGWMISSTAIFGCGAFTGFTEVPSILEPITYLFLFSTLAQSLTSIPMAIKYRAHEPAIQRGFISSAISSSSSAITGFWLGPFGDHVNVATYLPNLPDFGLAVVIMFTLGDSLYNLNAFSDMKVLLDKMNEMDPVKDSKVVPDKITEFITTFPVGLPMNVAMLQQLWVHASDARMEFLDILVSRGSSSALVFYALMITSIAICVGNLTATLSHRKLISADVNNFATVSALVATLVFNIRAAGIDIF